MSRNRRFALFVLAALALFAVCHGYWGREAGTVHGAELERLVVDGVTYLRDDADRYQQYSAADAGRYLGRALSGDRPRLWVYAVKDDPDRNVLYVRDGYDGAFSVREGWRPSDSRR
ncbi:MAG: hypothetical protein IJC43_10445 [Clostridia bacterium]|nr:hypothetical protein [Clostridia bacterium]